jgi:hypothetical protein
MPARALAGACQPAASLRSAALSTSAKSSLSLPTSVEPPPETAVHYTLHSEAGEADLLTSEGLKGPKRADELFFFAPVFAEETFEFLGQFVARGQVARTLVYL